jgi:hypothetical protein
MRWILLVLLVTLFWVNSPTYGQQSPSELEAIQQLKKLGVFENIDDYHTDADVHLSYTDTLKALELFRHVKKLESIHVQLGKSESTEEFWKRIAAMPGLRRLQLSAERSHAIDENCAESSRDCGTHT